MQKIVLSFVENAGNSKTGVYIAVAAVLALLLLACVLARFITDFSQELRLLNIEIERTEGEEREHYIRERRRLWLSLFPFIRY